MSPQVQAALIAAVATLVGVGGTVVVALRGFRATKEATDATIKAQGNQLEEQHVRTLNERFATAADKLGMDKPAAVRLAGIYAMAGLADDWKDNRQTCIDVLCAYLRIPYAADPGDGEKHLAFLADREVRQTAIRVVANHLRDSATIPWCDADFDFTGVVFDAGDFSHAKFSGGRVSFRDAKFSSGEVDFSLTEFSCDKVDFSGTKFSGAEVRFGHTTFSGKETDFSWSNFSDGEVDFSGTIFSGGTVEFYLAKFSGATVNFGGGSSAPGRATGHDTHQFGSESLRAPSSPAAYSASVSLSSPAARSTSVTLTFPGAESTSAKPGSPAPKSCSTKPSFPLPRSTSATSTHGFIRQNSIGL